MRKVLCYIYEGMADFEITFLLHRLRNTGKMEIISISEEDNAVTAQSGLSFVPMKKISEIDALEEIEALIIPGGPIDNCQNSICPLVKKMIGKGKLVAAICFGPQFLGRADILKDYKYTTSCSEEKIKKIGCDDPFFRPNYISQRCVVDRNLITSQGYAFIDFAKEVCEYLQIFDNEKQEYEQIGRVKE